MFYVGLDVHTTQITVCVLKNNGKVHKRWTVRELKQLIETLSKLTEPFQVCFEASCNYGWLSEALKKVALRVVVAHPGQLRLIFRSRKKNDRNDAEKLAKLLYVDQLPEVHVPPADVRAWRELVTFRKRTIEKRTRAKNGIRALLRSLGIKAPTRPGLWTKAGMQWLKELTFEQSLLAIKRDILVQEIDFLTMQVQSLETELKKFSRDNPAVFQLQSIPGVGLRTAETMVAFIDDPHRFKSSKQVGAYFGLVPTQDQSSDKNRLGHITRQGSAAARAMLTEAAWQAIRRSATVRAYFERIQRDDPARKKIALVATSHYLSRVMWAMLKHGTLWKEAVPAVSA